MLDRNGFTILEVMIVLAVSSAMLVTAIVLFGGQQGKVQFTQSIRDVESKIQDVMNDVSIGFIPSSTTRCSPGVNGPTFPAGVVEQGANPGCIFVGKAIHFKRTGMSILTLVGNRFDIGTGLPVTTFAASRPVVVDSLTEDYPYQWGMQMSDSTAGTSPVLINSPTPLTASPSSSMLVIASSVNGTGDSVDGNGQFNSGIQSINAFASGTINGQTYDDVTVDTVTTTIDDSMFADNNLAWVGGDSLILCFQDESVGSSGRQARGVRVTYSSGGLAAKVEDGLCA